MQRHLVFNIMFYRILVTLHNNSGVSLHVFSCVCSVNYLSFTLATASLRGSLACNVLARARVSPRLAPSGPCPLTYKCDDSYGRLQIEAPYK